MGQVMTCSVDFFFEWQELIWLHHFASYEYFRIMIWHGLNLEHFQNLENLKNLGNWMLWTFRELTCSFRSILSSDLGLNSFESCSLYKNKVLPLMSAGANWEIFGEKVLVFVNWGSCNHCFQNEWTFVGKFQIFEIFWDWS